jgi:hypothetical protein
MWASVLTLVRHLRFRFSWSLICLPTAFQRVLGFINPTSIVAVPEFNKFLVYCDTALLSYPLDLVIRVSQGSSTPKTLDDSVERLAQKVGNVLFFKTGRVAHRTLSKGSGHVSGCVRFLIPKSCLCNKGLLACYTACTRINSPG